ncbi:ankyrin repeat domain 7 [Rhinolophus ferrumequinum]|uniref:Ankyrin repeat domain 7 n=1 Tax=Rhinolophus ferrumequinum TaxID=59479 RepID=A0A7J7RHW5_RHIFE|nr:ankyrin repeat domain 7 [Rhinolophus ferrumequinum]
MKKLCTFWKRKDEPHSPSSHLGIDPAGTRTFADPGCNLRDKDLKKLHTAAAVGDLEKVKEYLQLKKYDVNIRDRKYRTPLHLACTYGYSNVVSLLIEKQCKINVWDSENSSPLIKAVQFEKEACATILLDQGGDPNLVDLDGNTALHYAVCGQSVSLVRKLLEHNANLEAQNKDGYTPLLLAITENNAEMVEFLLKIGADVNASDKNQRTGLMIALGNEPSSLVSLLLQREVDLSCQDIDGFTAEEYASFNGFTIEVAARVAERVALAGQDRPQVVIQFERGQIYHHLHVLIDTNGIKSVVLGRYLVQIKERLQQPELQRVWTHLQRAALNLQERKQLVEEGVPGRDRGQLARECRRQNSSSSSTSGDPVDPSRSRATHQYMELVNWLVEIGITSESNGFRRSRNPTAGSVPHRQSIEDDRIRCIFHLHGCGPAYAGSVVLAWCRRKSGQRNAVWLFGPAPTGKTSVAVSTAHAVPFYGRVNWTSENFLSMIVWTRR